MMRPPLSIIALSLASVFLLSSCASRQTAATLDDVETYIQSRPDSALATLRAIDTTTLTSRSLRAHYALLLATALDKNWIDTTDVNVVMPAVTYYDKHGTDDQKMRAYYYLGRIQQNGHDPNSAIISFTLAERASAGSEDDGFKGLLDMALAEIYRKAHFMEKARDCIESGAEHFRKANDTAHYNLTSGLLAICYQEMREWETADSLYRDGIERAVNDTSAMRMILAHYAAFKVIQPDADPKGAISLLTRLYSEYKQPLPPKEYSIYAYASDLLGDHKTCDAMLKVLRNLPEERRKDSRYCEYLIAKSRGDYEQAVDLATAIYGEQDKKVDQLLNNSVTQVLQNYFQNQYAKTEQRAQILRLVFAVAILSLLLLLGLIVFMVNRKREKERLAADLLRQSNSELKEQYKSLQQSYANLFKDQFDAVNELCKTYLKTQGKTEETRKTAIYGKVKDIIAFIGEDKKQHALFEEQINRDLDDIVAHLKADLGNVSDEDSRFICYTIAGFDTNIVATLLNLSVSNVYTKRSRLRERIRKLDSPHKEQYLRVI
ncbi:MAG: hypothetical protein II607_05055 [Bacteroidales bacterium]|nr:hypothetical protein [Bacteroidales bacterium]